jgi:flagellar motor switch protein FliM
LRRLKTPRESAPTTWRPRSGSCAAACRRSRSSTSVSRLLRIGLFNFLRRSAEVSVGSVRVSKYSEFIRNLVVPTNLNLIHMKPLRGTALMVFDPGLVFLLVDNLFGGDGRFHTRVEGRDFTQTEQRIIMRILDIVFEAYAKSWEPVYPIEFEYIRSEMNTQFANIATPNEVVVSSTFTVELGPVSGQIHFCMPYSMIEPIRDALTSSLQGEALEVDKRWIRLMTQQIQVAEVELVADLGHGKANFDDHPQHEGRRRDPDHRAEPVQATVDGVPVMECTYGVFNGQYALKVEKCSPTATTFNKHRSNTRRTDHVRHPGRPDIADDFQEFSGSGSRKDTHRNDIDFILDIPVQLTVELGRTKIAIKNLLQLAQGSVVELDGLAGEPMDVLVNGCLIAQGEVVVVNDKFGIRLTDIITPSERIRKLNK